jgi:hypothetical protein
MTCDHPIHSRSQAPVCLEIERKIVKEHSFIATQEAHRVLAVAVPVVIDIASLMGPRILALSPMIISGKHSRRN